MTDQEYRPRVVTLCGSSRFVEVMAVVAWLLERDEGVITMGLHLLPHWYSVEPIPDHLAEVEGVADQMDALHLRKIEISDEIFVIDCDIGGKPYVGESTAAEIRHAEGLGLRVRRLSLEPALTFEIWCRASAAIEACELGGDG